MSKTKETDIISDITDIISEIREETTKSIRINIQNGDMTTIRYYVDNINHIGSDDMTILTLSVLKQKIKELDIEAISIFNNYFSIY